MKASLLPQALEQAKAQGAVLIVHHYYDGAHFPSLVQVTHVHTHYYFDGKGEIVVTNDDPTQMTCYDPNEEVEAYAVKKIELG